MGATREQVKQIAAEVHTEIINHKQFHEFKRNLNASHYEIEILNTSHFEAAVDILATAFSSGGGNYEVIKGLNKADMEPFARSWVASAVGHGLSLVVVETLTGKVAYVQLNEVVGYDENAPLDLNLSANGKRRQRLRRKFERNDPFWCNVLKQKERGSLAYGSVLAPIGGKNADLLGQGPSATLGLQYDGLWLLGMYRRGVLAYFIADATHWKMIELLKRSLKVKASQFGEGYF